MNVPYIPAKAGIQYFQGVLDPGFRWGYGVDNPIFLKLMTLSYNLFDFLLLKNYSFQKKRVLELNSIIKLLKENLRDVKPDSY